MATEWWKPGTTAIRVEDMNNVILLYLISKGVLAIGQNRVTVNKSR